MPLHVIRFVLTIIDSDFAAAATARGVGEQNVNLLQLNETN
jgi:hypothetical protein